MSLVSSSQMAFIRKMGNLGLLTDVELRPMVIATDQYGGDPHQTWPATGIIIKGWILQTNQPPIDDRNGVSTTYGSFRLQLPADSPPIAVGDQVCIGGLLYTVNNTNDNDTYRVFSSCLIKRIEDRASPL
jgi:hypothetical protein